MGESARARGLVYVEKHTKWFLQSVILNFERCVAMSLASPVMDNCTLSGEQNCSTTSDGPGPDLQLGGNVFLVYSVIISLVMAAIIVAYVLTIATLCSVRSMAKTLQIFLINLLCAGLATAVIADTCPLSALTVHWAGIKEPSLPFCRFALWGYGAGAIVRLFSMAAFSVTVLLVVRYSVKALKYAPIVLTLALLWLGAILLNTHVLVPPVFAVQYVDGVACFPRTRDANIIKPARYALTAIWVVFGGVTPVVISIVVPILVLCYIKRNRVTEGSDYNKGIAKFALFLVSGNLINLLGQAVVGGVVYSSSGLGVYITYGIVVLSLLPTPILVIIFLKPVRDKMRAALFCLCLRGKPRVVRSSMTDKTLSTV